jgi:hypothetical protein
MSRETYGWWRGIRMDCADKECERGGNERKKGRNKEEKRRRDDRRKENRKYKEETKGEIHWKKDASDEKKRKETVQYKGKEERQILTVRTIR